MDECDLCGAGSFGFHVCATSDLRTIVVRQGKRIRRLESKLTKAKKKGRKHG